MFQPEDKFLALAKGYAEKLRTLDPIQLLFADHLIHQVLLEGQLKNLNKNSTISVYAGVSDWTINNTNSSNKLNVSQSVDVCSFCNVSSGPLTPNTNSISDAKYLFQNIEDFSDEMLPEPMEVE